MGTFAETLSTFLVDQGETASWTGLGGGSGTATVLYWQPDTTVLGRRVLTRGYKIRFQATNFVGIEQGDQVQVHGGTFDVLEVQSVDDGGFYEAQLERTA